MTQTGRVKLKDFLRIIGREDHAAAVRHRVTNFRPPFRDDGRVDTSAGRYLYSSFHVLAFACADLLVRFTKCDLEYALELADSDGIPSRIIEAIESGRGIRDDFVALCHISDREGPIQIDGLDGGFCPLISYGASEEIQRIIGREDLVLLRMIRLREILDLANARAKNVGFKIVGSQLVEIKQ